MEDHLVVVPQHQTLPCHHLYARRHHLQMEKVEFEHPKKE